MKSEAEARQAIEEYGDMVKRICFMYLKNEEEIQDIFQNVFLKYVLFPDEFESKEHEKAWIIRISINECKDILKSFFRKTVPLELVEEHYLKVTDENNELLHLVLALPEKYKDVVYLFYYEGYSAVQIAQMFGKNENTIYSRPSRAKKILKEELGGDRA